MNFCRISPFHRTHRTVCRDPAPATGWGAPPGPDPMRRDLPSPVPTARPVGGVFHLRAGRGRLRVAVVGDLHAHMAPAPALPGARLRRARRDLSFEPRRSARTRGDGLAFASGVYLDTACCVVANEFYASGMAKLAGQVGHPVNRAWVVRFLAYFVVTSTVLLLAAVERRGGHGEVRHGRVALLAAACAALIALSCLGIVGRYPYYTIPRTAQMLVCLCALHPAGDALERAGSRLEASGAAPEGEAG